MLKAIKREMKGGLPMLWLALGISWGLALVLEVTVNSISAASGFQNDGWLSIGGVVALGAAGLVFFVSGAVQFSSSFHLAITMGCTRRTYLLSAFVANVVLALAALLATWPISRWRAWQSRCFSPWPRWRAAAFTAPCLRCGCLKGIFGWCP